MKKITCIALLALLFTNCKQNNSSEESKPIEKTADTITIVKEKKVEKKTEQKEDCKDIAVEMGDGRECIIQDTDLEKVYQNIIRNKEVEESNYFLVDIPNESKSIEVNQNGLISIDYQISKNKVAISMNYEGGVTDVTLEKINNTVKRSIYHYTD
jgi:PBP1b-binding outer membrane lipoprotein LpoB